MSEMIVKLNQDRVKIKGCEYVQDLIRCGECKHNIGLRDGTGFWEEDITCDYWESDGLTTDDFCSYAEMKGE